MDFKLQLLDNFPSTIASNFWDCLTKPGLVNFHISPTSWLKLRPQVGEVPIIPIRYEEDVSTMPIALSMLPGVLLSTPVLLTFCGVLNVHAPPDAVSTNISFVTGVRSIYGVNLIAEFPWFVGRGKAGMVQKLNNLCSRISLLV